MKTPSLPGDWAGWEESSMESESVGLVTAIVAEEPPTDKPKKLLDRVREVMRVRRYSIQGKAETRKAEMLKSEGELRTARRSVPTWRKGEKRLLESRK